MKNKAIIFDMDGVIINSELLWDTAMTEVMQRTGIVFGKGDAAKTRGLRTDEAVQYWYDIAPWDGVSVHSLAVDICARMIPLIEQEGEAMPGAISAIHAAAQTDALLAIASSSSDAIIQAVVERLNITNIQCLVSAQHEKRGKPAPDVYLTAAKRLGVAPEDCIAIEDSKNGMKSARAAGMKVIGIPDSRFTTVEEVIGLADVVETSLEGFTKERFESLLV